jgi:hypothetical protein
MSARRVPDISKIQRLVGYKPKVHLDEILARVIEYWEPQSAAVAPGLQTPDRAGELVTASHVASCI